MKCVLSWPCSIKLSLCTADLLVSVLSGTEPGCSTSTLRDAMALTVSASSFSDWPWAPKGPSSSECPLVWDKLWRQDQCLPAGTQWEKEIQSGSWEDTISWVSGSLASVSYSGSLLLSPGRRRLLDRAAPEATETQSRTDGDREKGKPKNKCSTLKESLLTSEEWCSHHWITEQAS